MNLETLRKNKGLTLEEVAIKINRSKQGYWNYEKGKRNIPYNIAVKLSKIFDVTTDEIYRASENNQNI